jgi:probable HAF family extracellular repeat protein
MSPIVSPKKSPEMSPTMSRIRGPQRFRRRLILLLPCLLGGAALAGVVVAQPPQPAAAAANGHHGTALPGAYRVINLGTGDLRTIPQINDNGQVAFTLSNLRALFYDGTRVVDLGTLGGSTAGAGDVNNAGQVVGASALPGDPPGVPGVDPFTHAFLWSRNTGMIDLGTLGGTRSGAAAINERGQVAGNSLVPTGDTHAFRWSAAFGLEDIGLLPGSVVPSLSFATDISDSGLVTGWALNADRAQRGFVWTRKTGMIELGTFGGLLSNAGRVNAHDQVVGTALVPGNLAHAFIWDARNGQQDLGTGAASESYPIDINDRGQVVGGLRYSMAVQHGFSWTRASGIVDIGTLGGTVSSVFDVNDKGHVVGASTIRSGPYHAFVWTARDGMVDLNKRLRHAPAGLVLDTALAISNNGSIVSTSNAGLVLLKPDCGCTGPHAVGPIASADMVEVGTPFDGRVSFAGSDTTARHHVSWSWGDGSGAQAGQASGSNGSSTALGNHTYAAPGIYTISATVTDLGGNSTTVTRKIIAYDKAGGQVRGSGSLLSPQGTSPALRTGAGPATFSFIAATPSGSEATAVKAELQFGVGTSTFRSKSLKAVTLQGGRAQFEGSATMNGDGDYRFTLTTTAGGNQVARLGLKVWHVDPVTRAEVVDYDNLGAGPGNTGSAVWGTIVHQP